MLSRYTGSFPAAIKTLSEILQLSGTVLPATTDKATLVAELSDGRRIYGESAIDIPRTEKRAKIKDIFLVPHYNNSITVYPPVIDSIKSSDYIFIGPGDLFTSIIANLIVPGIKKEIQKTSAKIIFILNIMTKFGETHNFRGSDFVRKLEEYLNRQVDGIIYNTRRPSKRLVEKYLGEKAEFVELDKSGHWIGDRAIYDGDLLNSSTGIARHDPIKLAHLIDHIIFREAYVNLRLEPPKIHKSGMGLRL